MSCLLPGQCHTPINELLKLLSTRKAACRRPLLLLDYGSLLGSLLASKGMNLAPREPAEYDHYLSIKYVSLFQIVGNGEELAEMVQKNLENGVEYYYPKELNGSLQLSNDTSYSLRIANTTSHNSGTYRCTLWAPVGEYNQSGTIILKVTGCTELLDEKFKKYRAELLLLSCLGIFYLLLIFFTCVSSVFYIFGFAVTKLFIYQ
uniref:CD83 molecule n=1 Tax=Pelusios castaneus TaxID=367368 RepID=A0A8C8RU83_9SAUR